MTGLLMREFLKQKQDLFLSSFSKHLDGIESKSKSNSTRSNESKNEPKLAGILGVTSQPFPPIELQLALFQSE